MSDPFVGEIRMFGGTFAPRGWALCDGALLDIALNSALFSLLGTIYGGDGRTTFGLPDLRGRVPVHAGAGAGPGVTQRRLGERGGQETVTMATTELPDHTHPLPAYGSAGSTTHPSDAVLAAQPGDPAHTSAAADVDMHAQAVGSVGGGQAHDNIAPSLAVYYIIALVGTYPSRN